MTDEEKPPPWRDQEAWKFHDSRFDFFRVRVFEVPHRGVMIPGLESILEPDFEAFSENCDSDSDSSSNSYWNRFQSGIDSKGGIDSSAGIGSRVGIDSNQRMGSTE